MWVRVPYLASANSALVIIHNLDIERPFLCPNKANTIFFVDPYAMLFTPIMFERLQVVSGRDSKFIKQCDRIQQLKPAPRNTTQLVRASPSGRQTVDPIEKIFRSLVCERLDHVQNIACASCYVNPRAKRVFWNVQIPGPTRKLALGCLTPTICYVCSDTGLGFRMLFHYSINRAG